MKDFLACMLIFTIVFPAYCFAHPQETTSQAQGLMGEINWIVEDGIIEKAELENLMQTLDETGIVAPSQLVGESCAQAILLNIVYLWLSIEAGGVNQVTSIIYLIINIGRIVSEC